MGERKVTYTNIDEYIEQSVEDVKEILKKLREVIQKAAPEATERITWDMPTFYLHGNLVHFAAFKKHIGFFPGPSGIDKFEEAAKYRTSKGTMQFQLKDNIPYDLVTKIVKFRIEENIKTNQAKELEKKKK